jgi:hypothetical protein
MKWNRRILSVVPQKVDGAVESTETWKSTRSCELKLSELFQFFQQISIHFHSSRYVFWRFIFGIPLLLRFIASPPPRSTFFTKFPTRFFMKSEKFNEEISLCFSHDSQVINLCSSSPTTKSDLKTFSRHAGSLNGFRHKNWKICCLRENLAWGAIKALLWLQIELVGCVNHTSMIFEFLVCT